MSPADAAILRVPIILLRQRILNFEGLSVREVYLGMDVSKVQAFSTEPRRFEAYFCHVGRHLQVLIELHRSVRALVIPVRSN